MREPRGLTFEEIEGGGIPGDGILLFRYSQSLLYVSLFLNTNVLLAFSLTTPNNSKSINPHPIQQRCTTQQPQQTG